jgi:N-acetylmuramoyl-L-alanine amidase
VFLRKWWGGMKAGVFKAVKTWRPLAALAAACLIATVTGFAAASAATGPSGLLKVRFGGDEVSTRVVLELSDSAQAKLVSKDGADEVMLDLPKIKASGDTDGEGRGLVKAWTVDAKPGAARLHLVLSKPAEIERRFLLPPSDGVSVYRYVIDLKATNAAKPSVADKTPVKIAAAAPSVLDQINAPASTPVKAAPKSKQGFSLVSRAEASTMPVSLRPNSVVLKRVVVIDAGHGGHDPGASGANVHEKDLTLAAAKALKARLEATGRYRVVMTRDEDVFVPLENRVQIARKANADLFISLHADAGGNTSTRGASVYTLSDQGSQRVVRGVTGDSDWFKEVSSPSATQAVREILHDLTQRATRNRSAQFADLLVGRLNGKAELLTRAHRDAGYMVLLAPDVPAVLLEMGFVTNLQDEKFLSDADKRVRFTGAIADAIDDYFANGVQIAMD